MIQKIKDWFNRLPDTSMVGLANAADPRRHGSINGLPVTNTSTEMPEVKIPRNKGGSAGAPRTTIKAPIKPPPKEWRDKYGDVIGITRKSKDPDTTTIWQHAGKPIGQVESCEIKDGCAVLKWTKFELDDSDFVKELSKGSAKPDYMAIMGTKRELELMKDSKSIEGIKDEIRNSYRRHGIFGIKCGKE